MTESSPLIVVLAAGKGTRMKSDLPKVMHKVAGRSMLGHVLALAGAIPGARVATVIGPGMEEVGQEALRQSPGSSVFVQTEQLGTANAVLAAREALQSHRGEVIVLYADTPLIEVETIVRLRQVLADGAKVAVLGFEAENPTGYGRLILNDQNHLVAIREQKDATDEERRITLCNSGVMALGVDNVLDLLDRIGNDNANGEYYLTDAVQIAIADGATAAVVRCPEEDVLGVNARDQLAAAEAIWQRRARHKAMVSGVTMIAPETVWLSYDTEIGRDVIIEPNVFITPGVKIESGAHIRANTFIEGQNAKSQAGVIIQGGASVGPFARMRPGAHISTDAHIGNFVEVKNAVLGPGAKANHLAYIGDADVGPGCNIGAGTIFCNYDGVNKARSTLGAGVFTGSNTAIVAPVKLGDGSYVAAGSTITKNVSPNALAIERSQQHERPNWAETFRAKSKAKKTGE